MSEEKNKSILANNLTYYMNLNKIDRNTLCDALKLKYSTVSEWLSGKKYPRIDKIELLAEYFGIQKSDLIEDKRINDSSIAMYSIIGERIKQARQAKGITQSDLADAIQTTKQCIYKYENGIVTNIPISKIESLADFLNVSPAYIMGWTNEPEEVTLYTLNLKERRLELGLTMLEVANAVGVSEATISRYESGDIKNMRRDRIVKYARILNVEPAEFISETEKSSSHDSRREALRKTLESLSDESLIELQEYIKYLIWKEKQAQHKRE